MSPIKPGTGVRNIVTKQRGAWVAMDLGDNVSVYVDLGLTEMWRRVDIVEDCECGDEGPCEQHQEILIQREGAGLRSADELCVLYLEDALSIDPGCLSPVGKDTLARAKAALADASPSSWIDGTDLSEELQTLVHQVENYLTDYTTYWHDGYSIVKITGGPLTDED